MSILKRKWVPMVIVPLCLVLMVSGWRSYDSYRVREAEQRDLAFAWIYGLRNSTLSIDHSLAVALVARDSDTTASFIQHARTAAIQGYTVMRLIPFDQETKFKLTMPQNLERIFRSYDSYLGHLAAQRQANLSSEAVQSLELIRQQVRTIDQKLLAVHDTFAPKTLTKIMESSSFSSALDELLEAVEPMEHGGTGDSAYQAYLKARYANDPTLKPQGLFQSSEPKLSILEMQQMVTDFLQGIVNDVVLAEMQPSSHEEQYIGRTETFRITSEKPRATLSVTVSEKGGHVVEVEVRGKASDLGGNSGLLELADTLIERWAELEGEQVQQFSTEESDSLVSREYVVVRSGVPIVSRLLRAYFLPGDSASLQFDARTYFSSYTAALNLVPRLSPAEAIASLRSVLKATGEPKLEVRHYYGEQLVYNIPVSGLTGVESIYINAQTGEYSGLELDRDR